MSTEYHRHCQATVLSANGTGNGNGATWPLIRDLSLPNLDNNWLSYFSSNQKNITQDLAGILHLIDDISGSIKYMGTVKGVKINSTTKNPDANGIVDVGNVLTSDSNFVHKTGNETISGNKTFTNNAIFSKIGGFSYTGIQQWNANNVNRNVWFSDNTEKGRPVYDSSFQYEPTTKVLSVNKLKQNVELVNSPSDTASGHEVVDAAWVRKVIQVDDSTVVQQYVSSSGNDNNDGKSVANAKKTIIKAMETLNKYRLSSATGLDITLYISGNYDLYANRNGNQPVIAHPDAVNQNNLLISGDSSAYYDSNGKIKIDSSIFTSYPVVDYNWYLLFNNVVSNIKLQNIRISGFSKINEVTGASMVCMNTPYVKCEFINVEFYNFNVFFNGIVDSFRMDLHNYVAFSKVFPMTYSILCFRGISGKSYDLSSSEEFKPEDTAKLVLKDISSIPENGITNWHNGSPYAGKRWRSDIVLDNVTAKLSAIRPGFKRGVTNGSEYYYYFYCGNGTDIKTVMPNIPEGGDKYNVIINVTNDSQWPSWYDPHWDEK